MSPRSRPWGQPLGDGIHRGEPAFRRWRCVDEDPILRVRHFQSPGPEPHFAEAAHAVSGFQAVELALSEMKEAQRQVARIVLQGDQPAPPAPVGDAAFDNLPFHQALPARLQLVQGDRARPVLVPVGKVQQQVDQAVHAQPARAYRREPGRHPSTRLRGRRRPDFCPLRYSRLCVGLVLDLGETYELRVRRTQSRSRQPSSTRIPSTSTCAPRGKAATPMAARAGYGSPKNSAITAFTAGKLPMSVR